MGFHWKGKFLSCISDGSPIQELEELAKVQELEEALEDTIQDIEHAKIPNNETLPDIEKEYESKLSAKEEEISSLKARLFESVTETCNVETVSRNVGDADLLKQIEVLKEKVEELEMDCTELTNENLELLFKLKEAKTASKDGGASEELLSNMLKDQSFSSFESEVSSNLFRIFHSEDMLQEKNAEKISNDSHTSIRDLQITTSRSEIQLSE
ncbi:uncharacterized protein [Cicer arietinum]|uniref:uncharacterized protein n=1 Tax=Cicer arietinum TaxID=3827 RepID=UPI003CC6C896